MSTVQPVASRTSAEPPTAPPPADATPRGTPRERAARDHLWLSFTAHDEIAAGAPVPTLVRGEGHHIYDSRGHRLIDGLAGLFVVQVGHGRRELAEAAAAQAGTLGFFPLWSYAHPPAIDLAERLAHYAPGDLDRVFFANTGSEAVETAFKLAKRYWRAVGRPGKHKVISRVTSYHGTTQGALAITGLPEAREPFSPVVPGGFKVPNTCFYRAPEYVGHEEKVFGRWAADQIEATILAEGPESVAAVFLEPVQNAGGCLPPPPGYFDRVREICDEHDVLLVSDEVICAFGRIGSMFACDDLGYVPDMITCAKGMTSGYSPLGATVVSQRIYEPFTRPGEMFEHGYTFAGHPVSAAVAMANLDLMESEGLNEHVKRTSPAFRATLERLLDLPIVGDVRGAGFFFGIELVKDKATKESLTAEECQRVLYDFLSPRLYEAGLYCRADDRGEPVIQLAPPLTIDQPVFDEMEQILRGVLSEAWGLL